LKLFLENTERAIKMDNPEKLATLGTQDEENQKHNATPLCTNKHK
jgi:hypothetical protein